MAFDREEVWIYRARPIRVVDGDTFYVLVDHGMSIHSTQSLRLRDVDTPEIFSGTEEEKVAGQAAKAFVEQWMSEAPAEEWPLRLRTRKDARSFNRYVAEVWTWDGRSLAEDIYVAGHGE